MESPLESFQGDVLKEKIAIVPILRSGLGFVDGNILPIEARCVVQVLCQFGYLFCLVTTLGMLNLIPEANVLHLGLFREKVKLLGTCI
jgi:uracil phosphoribosyltransferase